jgi:methionyl-tRNA formyltransferase
VRALAPPYPGARTTLAGRSARILRTRVLDAAAPPAAPSLGVEHGGLVARCGGGGALSVLELELDGQLIGAADLAARTGSSSLVPGT